MTSKNETFMFILVAYERGRIQAMAYQARCYLWSRQGFAYQTLLGDKQSVLPVHNADVKTGTVEGIKKQLGLKGK